MVSNAKVLKMSSENKLDKKKKAKQQSKPKAQRTSPQQYFKEVRLELKKVAWPSRQEVFALTGIVVVLAVVFALYTGILDSTFQFLLEFSTKVFRKG